MEDNAVGLKSYRAPLIMLNKSFFCLKQGLARWNTYSYVFVKCFCLFHAIKGAAEDLREHLLS